MEKLIKALQAEKEKAQARYKVAVANGMTKDIFYNVGRIVAYSKAIALAKGAKITYYCPTENTEKGEKVG